MGWLNGRPFKLALAGALFVASLSALTSCGSNVTPAGLEPTLGFQLVDGGRVAFQSGDVLVITQKVVSKREGRRVALSTVTPSARAHELSAITRKDARLVELVLRESSEILRAVPDVLIVDSACDGRSYVYIVRRSTPFHRSVTFSPFLNVVSTSTGKIASPKRRATTIVR